MKRRRRGGVRVHFAWGGVGAKAGRSKTRPGLRRVAERSLILRCALARRRADRHCARADGARQRAVMVPSAPRHPRKEAGTGNTSRAQTSCRGGVRDHCGTKVPRKWRASLKSAAPARFKGRADGGNVAGTHSAKTADGRRPCAGPAGLRRAVRQAACGPTEFGKDFGPGFPPQSGAERFAEYGITVRTARGMRGFDKRAGARK